MPTKISIINIGISHHFFLTFKKSQISPNKDLFCDTFIMKYIEFYILFGLKDNSCKRKLFK